MILNGNDYSRTRVHILMLTTRCDRLRRRIADPRQASSAQAEILLVEKRINELDEQMQTYLSLFRNTISTPDIVKLIDVPNTFIQRRIRLGLSQSDLGQACGQTRQCISRYERTLYAGASFSRLIQIDSLLRAEELRQIAPNSSSTEVAQLAISL